MSLKQQAFEAISKQRAHQQAIEGAIGNQRAHQSLNAYVGHVKEYEKVNANRAKQGGKRRQYSSVYEIKICLPTIV